MPDYQFNTNLGPAQQQGTSLGDLINTARGVQAYQQAEQVNPLALQKAQMEIEQAQKLNPLAVRKATAETGTAETGAKKATFGLTQDQAKVINENIGSVLNDERLTDPNPQRRVAPLLEARQRAIHSGVDHVMAEVMFAPYVDKALRDKNPNAVKDLMSGISNVQQSGIGASGQQALQSGGTVEFNGLKYQLNPVTKKAVPITLPGGGGGGAGGGNVPPAEGNKPAAQSLFQIDSPRAQGQFSTQESSRYELGAKDFADSTERAKAASDSALASSQIRRSLASAAGSKPGQLVRSTGKALFGNAEYDTLLKNLAEQQIRQAKLMGIDSVHAQQDLATANGSGDITQEALGHIVDRADAMNIATKKYNMALDNFQRKHGKEKAYLNNDNFKKAWADAYSPEAFIIQSTNQRNIPQKEKDAIIDYYTENMSESQKDELQKNMKKLKRLERGDY